MSDVLDFPKGNPGGSGYDRHEHDWYTEDRQCVMDLLDRETFQGGVYDPACGGGNIPKCCIERGISAVGSDLVARGYGLRGNFFDYAGMSPNIITNPPFGISIEFTKHALRHCTGKVAILQKLVWLEGTTKKKVLFEMNKLARVWVFRRRIHMPPGDVSVEAKGGKIAFAWFVFEADHNGPWTGGWIG